jgi:hypothetical protein
MMNLFDIETWLLIGFISLDFAFLIFTIFQHKKEMAWRQKEYEQLVRQTKALEKRPRKRQKREENPSRRND